MLKVLCHILLDTCTYLLDIMYWIYYCYFVLDNFWTLNFGRNCRIHFCFCITTVITVFGRLAMKINWLVSVWFRSWDQNVWFLRYVISINSICLYVLCCHCFCLYVLINFIFYCCCCCFLLIFFIHFL